MAEQSAISWTKSTFNPWSLPQALAAFQFALVSDAIWLEVSQFVARMAKRHAITNIKCEFWKIPHWFFMVRTKIAATPVTTLLAGVPVPLKNSGAPNGVLWLTAQAEISLQCPMPVCVVIFPARSSLPRYGRNSCPRFLGVFFSDAIGRPALRRIAHFLARLCTHLGAFFHG